MAAISALAVLVWSSAHVLAFAAFWQWVSETIAVVIGSKHLIIAASGMDAFVIAKLFNIVPMAWGVVENKVNRLGVLCADWKSGEKH